MSLSKAECIVIALVFGFWCFLFGRWAMENDFKNIAIEKGHAEYDSVTGKWKWREIKDGEK